MDIGKIWRRLEAQIRADSMIIWKLFKSPLLTGLLVAIAVPIGTAPWWLPSSGRQASETLEPVAIRPSGGTTVSTATTTFQRFEVGNRNAEYPPRITHVQVTDLDGDRQQEIVVCDARRNQVLSYDRDGQGGWTEQILAEHLSVPAHATVVDLDNDGDRDVVVSILGSMYPNDSKVGQIVWLENRGGVFEKQLLKDRRRRVADVQPGDFDQDGDIDLAVAIFGYARGKVCWFENLDGQAFREHLLLHAAGAIHVPVADYDGDGDLDIATVVSQEDEQVVGFQNLGAGQFQPQVLFQTLNYDLGSAGLVRDDLDQDGDIDLLLPVGDNLEYTHAYPQPYHGCYWLENRGSWRFHVRRIATFGGTYAAAAGDPDADGDRDVVLVSMTNDWSQPEHPSLIWLKNDGRQNFSPEAIARDPIHLITVACDDATGDGVDDIVTGGMNLFQPYERMGRVSLWTRTVSR